MSGSDNWFFTVRTGRIGAIFTHGFYSAKLDTKVIR